tara:strand:- start:2160 stop:3440 length:1281 start_codon:yes stop_codon:yes gene_type:complete
MLGGFVALLEVEGLTVRRGTKTILDNVRLTVDSGDCVILTGENGSGKSTLIESIAGILPIQSGSSKIVKPFGLTLQSGGINGDELVQERLEYSAQVAGIRDSGGLLTWWGLEHRRHDRIGQLSGGLYRRMAVLQGLMPAYGGESRICLLDEPSEGLDDASVEILISDIATLRDRGHAFLIATHDPRLHKCATMMLELGGESNEMSPTSLDTGVKSTDTPLLDSTDSKLSLSKWSSSLDRRTKWPLLSRGTPLIGSILLLYALIGNEIGTLVLVPTFLASIPCISSLYHAKDARSGDWWHAMGSRLVIIDPLTILLILISPIVTASIFGFEYDLNNWFLIGLPFVGIYLASGSIYELAHKMPRTQAQFFPLLTLVLIWPLLIVSGSVDECSVGGVCDGMVMSILFATAIPFIIAFGLPILHPRTASD